MRITVNGRNLSSPASPFRTTSRPPRGLFGRVNAKDSNAADLYLYDVIGSDYWGGISALDVAKTVEGFKGKKTLNVYINSPGGDCFEGIAIYEALRRFDGQRNVFVDGYACSMASVIALVGHKITTAHAARWMIHNPWSIVAADARGLRAQADELDAIREGMLDTYAARTKQKRDDLAGWCDAETWMGAELAKERGFTDEIAPLVGDEDEDEESAAALDAHPIFAWYKNAPAALRRNAASLAARLAEMDHYVSSMQRRRASPLTPPGQPGNGK